MGRVCVADPIGPDVGDAVAVRVGRAGLWPITASVRLGGRPLPVKVLWGPGLGNPTAAERAVQGYAAPHAVAMTQTGVERLRPDVPPED